MEPRHEYLASLSDVLEDWKLLDLQGTTRDRAKYGFLLFPVWWDLSTGLKPPGYFGLQTSIDLQFWTCKNHLELEENMAFCCFLSGGIY